MTTRLKFYKEEVVRLSNQCDETFALLNDAEEKFTEIQKVCDDAQITIDDLTYQVHFWENKCKDLKSKYPDEN